MSQLVKILMNLELRKKVVAMSFWENLKCLSDRIADFQLKYLQETNLPNQNSYFMLLAFLLN